MSFKTIRTLLFSLVIFTMAAAAYGQVGLFITVAPPPLPVYEQPLCPDDGYLWTPGYWAYDSDIEDYYWVPGTWVQPPEVGYLWTPAYWGWGGDRFVFYDGYWGPLVGFYGGINYGFGYFGTGFEGGRWDNGRFFYNQAVSNVNVTVIHNVYNNRVEQRSENRVSYNGGQGGLSVRPTPQQEAAARDRHVPPVAAQMQHRQEARSNPQQRASVNRGRPDVAATSRPGAYREGAVHAQSAGGEYTPPANRGGGAQPRENMGSRGNDNAMRPENNTRQANGGGGSTSYNHVREMPPYERPAPSGSDKNYQKQQDKMYRDQQKERDKISKQQQKEDQRIAKQHDEQAKQQVEQRHQQQTQEMQSRHQQQQQQMQQRNAPRSQPEPRSAPREQPESGRRPPV